MEGSIRKRNTTNKNPEDVLKQEVPCFLPQWGSCVFGSMPWPGKASGRRLSTMHLKPGELSSSASKKVGEQGPRLRPELWLGTAWWPLGLWRARVFFFNSLSVYISSWHVAQNKVVFYLPRLLQSLMLWLIPSGLQHIWLISESILRHRHRPQQCSPASHTPLSAPLTCTWIFFSCFRTWSHSVTL